MRTTTYFWEVSPGNQSANRLIFIIGVLWLIYICTYAIQINKASLTDVSIFFGTIFTLLAGAKLYQKSQEIKEEIKEEIQNKTLDSNKELSNKVIDSNNENQINTTQP